LQEPGWPHWPHSPLSDDVIDWRFSGVQRLQAYHLKVMVDSSRLQKPTECGREPDSLSTEEKRHRDDRFSEWKKKTEREKLVLDAQQAVAKTTQSLLTQRQTEVQADISKYYDFVLQINKFSDLYKNNGWQLLKDLEDKTGTAEKRFVIMGNFKRGKTWFLQKLCNVTLPVHEVLHTPGLCAKRLVIKKQRCMLIDTKGENTALDVVDTDSFQDKKAEESFLRDVICEIADAFMFLVGQMGFAEQLTLQQLMKLLTSHSVNKSGASVFVIHNLKHLRTREELKDAWDEVKNLYVKGQRLIEIEADVTLDTENVSVEYLEKLEGDEQRFPVRHFFLGAEGTDAGSTNNAVMEWIRIAMTTITVQKRSQPFLKDVTNAMNNKIETYLNSDKDLQLDIRDSHLKLVDPDLSPPKLRDMDLGNYVSIAKGEQHSTRYRIAIIAHGETMYVQVEIDIPGLKEHKFMEDMNELEDNDGKIVHLDPCGAGVNVTLRPWIVKELRDRDRDQAEEANERKPESPKIAVPDLILITEKLTDYSCLAYQLENGVLTLQWETYKLKPIKLAPLLKSA